MTALTNTSQRGSIYKTVSEERTNLSPWPNQIDHKSLPWLHWSEIVRAHPGRYGVHHHFTKHDLI